MYTLKLRHNGNLISTATAETSSYAGMVMTNWQNTSKLNTVDVFDKNGKELFTTDEERDYDAA